MVIPPQPPKCNDQRHVLLQQLDTSNSCVITWSKKTTPCICFIIWKSFLKEYLILYLSKSFKSINSYLFPITNNWNYLSQGLYWAQGICYRLAAPIREFTRELSWKKNRITYHPKSYSTLPSANMTIQNDSHLQVQRPSPIACRDYISTPLNFRTRWEVKLCQFQTYIYEVMEVSALHNCYLQLPT